MRDRQSRPEKLDSTRGTSPTKNDQEGTVLAPGQVEQVIEC